MEILYNNKDQDNGWKSSTQTLGNLQV